MYCVYTWGKVLGGKAKRGFPGSRNKKILKNKLYKKHRIKCVFITPSELNNLEMEIGRVL